ncbi:LDLR chaperone boca [Ixodes scapularis]|nr:LDLR chaperone boca [Ixodes scapularis]
MKGRHVSVAVFLALCVTASVAKKFKNEEKPAWAKKDIRDYNEADLERLYDQWEEDEEPLEPDELPEHLRPSPKIDLSNLDPSNPENILKMTKKGKMLMTFVSVTGNPTKQELEDITTIWQTSLMNNHISVDRFLIGENRAIFSFKDGSQAWEAKDFLVEQERLESITIENKVYPGKHSKAKDQEAKDEL